MTGKLVNLRTARKQRARAEARAKGDERAVQHGEAKAVRTLREAEAKKAARDLDGKKRE